MKNQCFRNVEETLHIKNNHVKPTVIKGPNRSCETRVKVGNLKGIQQNFHCIHQGRSESIRDGREEKRGFYLPGAGEYYRLSTPFAAKQADIWTFLFFFFFFDLGTGGRGVGLHLTRLTIMQIRYGECSINEKACNTDDNCCATERHPNVQLFSECFRSQKR